MGNRFSKSKKYSDIDAQKTIYLLPITDLVSSVNLSIAFDKLLFL